MKLRWHRGFSLRFVLDREKIFLSGAFFISEAGKMTGEVTPYFNREEYCSMVEQSKYSIREGDIFRIVYASEVV